MTRSTGRSTPTRVAADRAHAARSFWWSLGDSVTQLGLSLAFLLVLSRLLEPADFGVAALALGFATLPIVIVELLFNDALVQREEITDRHVDTAFASSLVLGLAAVGACLLLGPLLGRLLDDGRIVPVFRVTCLAILPSAFGAVLAAELRRQMRFRELALRASVARATGTALGIAAAFAGLGVWSIVLQLLASALLAAAIVWVLADRRPRPGFSLQRFRELLPVASSTLATELLWLTNLRVFIAGAGYLLGSTALGYIHISWRIVEVLEGPLKTATRSVSLPLFARRQNDRPAVERLFVAATELSAGAGFFVFGGLFVVADDVVALVLGPAWTPSVLLIRLFSLLAIAQFCALYAGVAVTATGRPHYNVFWSLACLGLTSAGLFFFGTTLAGAGLVWLLQSAAAIPLAMFLVQRATGIAVTAQLAAIRIPVVALACMVAAGTAARLALGGPPGWPGAAISGATAAATYLAVLSALRPQLAGELLRLAKPGRDVASVERKAP